MLLTLSEINLLAVEVLDRHMKKMIPVSSTLFVQ